MLLPLWNFLLCEKEVRAGKKKEGGRGGTFPPSLSPERSPLFTFFSLPQTGPWMEGLRFDWLDRRGGKGGKEKGKRSIS